MELEPGFKEPIMCYEFWPFIGGPDYINCTECGVENIIPSPELKPMTRLASPNCMSCEKRLSCPDCGYSLFQGMITERDAVLICDNKDCKFICTIW